jgi:hypothetical protein
MLRWRNDALYPWRSTLAEARRLALERNADFRVAQAQVDAALAQLKVAREFPNPTLGLSTAKISTDGTPEGTPLGNSLLNRATTASPRSASSSSRRQARADPRRGHGRGPLRRVPARRRPAPPPPGRHPGLRRGAGGARARRTS